MHRQSQLISQAQGALLLELVLTIAIIAIVGTATGAALNSLKTSFAEANELKALRMLRRAQLSNWATGERAPLKAPPYEPNNDALVFSPLVSSPFAMDVPTGTEQCRISGSLRGRLSLRCGDGAS